MQTSAAVSMCASTRIARQFAREVMIEIADRRAGPQQPRAGVAVLVVRDVEHGHAIAGARVDPFQQPNVALHARHERAAHALREPQLLKRAEAVRVAVEGKEMSFVVVLLHRPLLPFTP